MCMNEIKRDKYVYFGTDVICDPTKAKTISSKSFDHVLDL